MKKAFYFAGIFVGVISFAAYVNDDMEQRNKKLLKKTKGKSDG